MQYGIWIEFDFWFVTTAAGTGTYNYVLYSTLQHKHRTQIKCNIVYSVGQLPTVSVVIEV